MHVLTAMSCSLNGSGAAYPFALAGEGGVIPHRYALLCSMRVLLRVYIPANNWDSLILAARDLCSLTDIMRSSVRPRGSYPQAS